MGVAVFFHARWAINNCVCVVINCVLYREYADSGMGGGGGEGGGGGGGGGFNELL